MEYFYQRQREKRNTEKPWLIMITTKKERLLMGDGKIKEEL